MMLGGCCLRRKHLVKLNLFTYLGMLLGAFETRVAGYTHQVNGHLYMKRTERPLSMRNPLFLLGLTIIGLFFTSCSNSDSMRESQSRVPATIPLNRPTVAQLNAPIAVGDSIAFSVWGYPEFTTRTLVRPQGFIIVPVVGELMVVGYTKEEFLRVLRQKLGEYIQGDLKLTIEISSPVPRITVLGTVNRQGSFPASVEMPLLEVLSAAGGWTELSDLRYIKITRQATTPLDRALTEVDLTQYLDSGNIRGIPVVRPGDIVYVPKRENFVREVSDVLRDAFLLFGFFRLFN
ncbi:MAG: polysaccharide export protein [Bacteroidetes bacterium]|nr:polysaccharide export protein [Bacteroidota bacterium]